MWGIHNNRPELDLVSNGFISIGWDEMGDLTKIGPDKDAMKALVATQYPAIKPGAIPVWAGTLLRFGYELKVGDLVVYPYRPDSTLNFGRIASDYFYDATAPFHRSRRKVTWVRNGVSRAEFSQGALYEIGSAVTLFRVKNYAAEFEAFLARPFDGNHLEVSPSEQASPEQALVTAEDEPNADRIETHTTDFIIKTLLGNLQPVEFEHFVAHLLEAMGYRTQVTVATGDGGVDVIAHRDPLGLEPPIIKVQCKRTVNAVGAPTVQSLTGTLAPGGQELGLFVTLGPYSKDAVHLGRSRQDLRLSAEQSW